MSDFVINEQKIKEIAARLDTTDETVRKINTLYGEISAGIKPQYLAHVVRSVEVAIRKKTGNERFQIRVVPVNDADLKIGFGSAIFKDKILYIIYYPESMDPKQARVIIAHELGHLIVELYLKEEDPQEGISEPLSTLFGILTILDKNDFYANKTRELLHKDYREIINDFLLLRNEANGIYNNSD